MRRWFAGLAVALLASGVARAAPTPGRFVVDAKQETVYDHATGRTWQRGQAAGTFSWSAAQDWCKQMTLAGGGWRVPTIVELEGIVDRTTKEPAIDTAAFGPTTADAFWTASPALAAGNAWSVHFGAGNSSAAVKTMLFRVRCVR